MKSGDRVQVRRFDGAEHWLYGVVLDKGTPVRVQIQHPGNAENEKVLLLPASDIRTKADVQAILTQAQAIIAKVNQQHGLSHPQIKQLGELDGFWLNYLQLDEKNQGARINLHKTIVEHYRNMMKQLS